MKKVAVVFLAAFFAVLTLSISPVYAANAACNETVLDKAWDWGTTLGKSGMDKETKLAQNKTERAQKCAEKLAKQAQKDAGKAVDGMQKKLGL